MEKLNYKNIILSSKTQNYSKLSKDESVFLLKFKEKFNKFELLPSPQKFKKIDEFRDEFPIIFMCNYAGLSKSGYYKWIKNGKKDRKKWNEDLANKILAIHKDEPTYGYRRIAKEILRKYQLKLNHKTVYRYMTILNIRARSKRKFGLKNLFQNKPKIFSNRLFTNGKHNFKTTEKNKVWVCDITYLKTKNFLSGLYLFVILDLHDRSIISYSFSLNLKSNFILSALKKAITKNKSPKNLIIHSDQGTQFTSYEYSKLCEENQITISMSRKGSPQDNAVIEAFFSNMKHELDLYTWINKLSIQNTIIKIKKYLHKYNNSRIQKYTNWMTPLEFRYNQIRSPL